MQGRVDQKEVASHNNVAFPNKSSPVLFRPADNWNQKTEKANEERKAARGRGKRHKLGGLQQCNLNQPRIEDFVGVIEVGRQEAEHSFAGSNVWEIDQCKDDKKGQRYLKSFVGRNGNQKQCRHELDTSGQPQESTRCYRPSAEEEIDKTHQRRKHKALHMPAVEQFVNNQRIPSVDQYPTPGQTEFLQDKEYK